MKPLERIFYMLEQVHDMNMLLPETYNFLPMNDYFRMKQLLEEAEKILTKYKGR